MFKAIKQIMYNRRKFRLKKDTDPKFVQRPEFPDIFSKLVKKDYETFIVNSDFKDGEELLKFSQEINVAKIIDWAKIESNQN